MREKEYYVYILANTFHRLYTGVTNDLEGRISDHKAKVHPRSFTARYGIDRLVYFERFPYMHDAIAREKEIKGWNRLKKIQLIVGENPTWVDLSEEFGRPTEPFCEGKMRLPEGFA